MHFISRSLFTGCTLAVALPLTLQVRAADKSPVVPPKVGAKVPNIKLQPLEGKKVKLADLTKRGPVVLVFLRGYPGYQCPVCTQQVGDLRKSADQFAKANATVVLVYPGEAEGLEARAKEFLKDTSLPRPFLFTIDPDYPVTNKLGLRWETQAETAYPATFLIDQDRVVRFAKISKSHGDRAKASDILKSLNNLPQEEAKTSAVQR